MNCKCTLAQSLVGDGCDICNPAYALRMAKETIADLEKERDELQATADRFAEIMADKDRQLIAVARQREELLSAAIEARRALAHSALKNPLYNDEYDVIDKAIAKHRGQQS